MRSPATVEHHHRHHAVVLTELIYYLDILLDQEGEGRHRAERVQNTEVPYVRCLDRSYREDVRLHQPRCHNASAFGLQGYVDTLSPLVAMHLLDRSCVIVGFFLKLHATFPNSGIQARSMRR